MKVFQLPTGNNLGHRFFHRGNDSHAIVCAETVIYHICMYLWDVSEKSDAISYKIFPRGAIMEKAFIAYNFLKFKYGITGEAITHQC